MFPSEIDKQRAQRIQDAEAAQQAQEEAWEEKKRQAEASERFENEKRKFVEREVARAEAHYITAIIFVDGLCRVAAIAGVVVFVAICVSPVFGLLASMSAFLIGGALLLIHSYLEKQRLVVRAKVEQLASLQFSALNIFKPEMDGDHIEACVKTAIQNVQRLPARRENYLPKSAVEGFKAKFAQIKIRMTITQARLILGDPDEEILGPDGLWLTWRISKEISGAIRCDENRVVQIEPPERES